MQVFTLVGRKGNFAEVLLVQPSPKSWGGGGLGGEEMSGTAPLPGRGGREEEGQAHGSREDRRTSGGGGGGGGEEIKPRTRERAETNGKRGAWGVGCGGG